MATERARPSRLLPALVLLGVVSATGHTLLAQPAGTPRNTRSLATALAKLRTEVETLSSRIQTKRTELKAELQSQARQKADLELQVKREQLRIVELKKKIEKHKKRVAAIAKAQQDLVPVVRAAAKDLQARIAKTLPFKRKQRQQAVAQVVQKMDAKLISPLDALSRLWGRVEDELRLSRESGLYQQVIRLDEKEVLVQVARIGMVAMFYRTKDGRFGSIRRTAKGWTQAGISQRKQKEQVAKLFDAFKKQLRTGFFTIPNALPAISRGAK